MTDPIHSWGAPSVRTIDERLDDGVGPKEWSWRQRCRFADAVDGMAILRNGDFDESGGDEDGRRYVEGLRDHDISNACRSSCFCS